jgi:F0F1-type ATP synthase membrane subunit b/b'
MNANTRRNLMGLLALSLFGLQATTVEFAHADETMKEKAKETMNDAKRGAKKAARAAEDKTCEMVNGKMECAAKKVKHSIQNGADKVEDAMD